MGSWKLRGTLLASSALVAGLLIGEPFGPANQAADPSQLLDPGFVAAVAAAVERRADQQASDEGGAREKGAFELP